MSAIKSLRDLGIDKSSVKTLFKKNTVEDYIANWLGNKVDEVKQNLSEGKKDASGALSQSVRINPVQLDNGNIRFEFIMEDYWIWVDAGRKPGTMPPISNIVQWIFNKPSFKAKIGGTRKGLKGAKMAKLGDIQAPATILKAAYSVAKKIEKKGIKPTHFFTSVINNEAINDLKAEIKKKFKVDIDLTLKDVAKEAREEFEKIKSLQRDLEKGI